MYVTNIAECSSVFAGRDIPYDEKAIQADIEKHNMRCLILAYPANGNQKSGIPGILRKIGGFVIWNTHSAHNKGRGMDIWLIPGVRTGLYENDSAGVPVRDPLHICSPEPNGGLEEKQKEVVRKLNEPRKQKKRINWKKRYQNLLVKKAKKSKRR